MTAATILTLANGKGIDLLDPQAADIDFAAIAEHLAKENRYNGATPDICYSVAEHCVRCHDAVLGMSEDAELAAYLLLHDAHEAFLKDDTTPKKRAVAEIARVRFGLMAAQIIAAFEIATEGFDKAIHRAAGLAWPPPKDMRGEIKKFDLVLFVTEWRDLMHGVPHPNWAPYSGLKPLPDKIVPWPWAQARAAWLYRAQRILPALQGQAR